MKISVSRGFALWGATALVASASLPAGAHILDQKSFGQLKGQTKNFAHAQSAVVRMNQPMPDFAAPTLDGKGLSKASFKGKMGLFLLADTQCPCVQAVEERVKALSKKYSAQGLRVAYVFSTPGQRPLDIARFMQGHQIPFPAIVDKNQHILKMLDGQCSSEVYLTDKKGVLRYHGRVDDSTFDPKAVKSRDLENAILALSKGPESAARFYARDGVFYSSDLGLATFVPTLTLPTSREETTQLPRLLKQH